eukprot:6921910-Alexandrium_andersonii.AAC.1
MPRPQEQLRSDAADVADPMEDAIKGEEPADESSVARVACAVAARPISCPVSYTHLRAHETSAHL